MGHSIDCATARGILADLVATRAGATGRIARHLEACAACAAEYERLRTTWQQLPRPAPVGPSAAVRERVLTYARTAVAPPENLLAGLWSAVRDLTPPVGWGAGAALVLVVLLHVRGAVAPVGGASVAAALALVVGALTRGTAPPPVRTVLLGAMGGLAGYAALSLAMPVPAAFELCRVALFPEAAMSLAQVCLIYLGVAAAYAGIPLALAAYASSGPEARWRTGLAEGVVFAVLAAPVLVLQAGLDELMITATVFLGLVAGAVFGGLAGALARGTRLARRLT